MANTFPVLLRKGRHRLSLQPSRAVLIPGRADRRSADFNDLAPESMETRISVGKAASLSFRLAQRRIVILLVLLLLVLAILGGTIWRNLARLEQIRAYVGYAHEMEGMVLDLQDVLIDELSYRNVSPVLRIEALQVRLKRLSQRELHLGPQTPGNFVTVQTLLGKVKEPPSSLSDDERRIALVSALGAMGRILDDETEQRGRLLAEVGRDTQLELDMALAILAAIVGIAGWYLTRRVANPLNRLRQLLSCIAEEDFRPIAVDGLDPLLLPVFNSYNDMVRHLAELEGIKRRQAGELRAEVRAATHALMDQQHSLARAERLAAVGELAAEIAHELRNPLAGIQIACVNLRDELADAPQTERMDLIVSELHRMGRLLSNLLESSRHQPAAARQFDAVTLVRELLALVRYQIPDHIQLHLDAPDVLPVHLPECGFRQMLLNLILNAAEALGAHAGNIFVVLAADAAGVTIRVDDDGPGFPPDIIGQNIRAFRTHRSEGTGLGLAVAQRYVREHGGSLSLGNREPHGAQVLVFFPASPRS